MRCLSRRLPRQAERNHLSIFSPRYPLRRLSSEASRYEEFNDLRHKSPHICKNKAAAKKFLILTNLYNSLQDDSLEDTAMSEMAFHEKAGGSQGNSGFMLFDTLFYSPVRRCRHASIRTLEERFVRSVHVGRSRFSRCCHLISAL
jgi:hypothetical protein